MLAIYCRTSSEKSIETSTISQQRTIGLKFAEQHNFELTLYEDEGISGYTISDDDLDPFNNRPDFTKLINDIKTKKIDKVWVWEISRLSRNEYASAFIFNVFAKYNIKLYINQEEYDLTNPQNKLNRVILGAIAEYERHLIVNRTTRGSREQFAKGRKINPKLFCYENSGRDKDGYVIWKPVESEIETYYHILKRYKEGASLRKIVIEVSEMNNIPVKHFGSYAVRMGNVLRKYQYTGYQLNEEGNEIFKKFRKNQINTIQVLKDKKYWIKSIPYPMELISIEEWVDITERLQIAGSKLNFSRKERTLKASRDIGTGIINCGDCNARFYYKEQNIKNRNGKTWRYFSYFHQQFFNNRACHQKPKSFSVEHLNEIFKIFYFFFFAVFDNTNELMAETQKNIKFKQKKVKENIVKNEKLLSKASIQLERFETAVESTEDIDEIKTLSKLISKSNDKIEELNNIILNNKIEFEKLSEMFSKNLLEITFYEVTDKINNWFYKMNIEEQRSELIKVIQGCFVYNNFIIIDTGRIVFLFDINDHHVFNMELLKKLNEGIIYKEYFIENKGKSLAKMFNDKRIPNINLNRDEEIRMRVFQYLIKTYNIVYDISDKTNLISFVPLRGIL